MSKTKTISPINIAKRNKWSEAVAQEIAGRCLHWTENGSTLDIQRAAAIIRAAIAVGEQDATEPPAKVWPKYYVCDTWGIHAYIVRSGCGALDIVKKDGTVDPGNWKWDICDTNNVSRGAYKEVSKEEAQQRLTTHCKPIDLDVQTIKSPCGAMMAPLETMLIRWRKATGESMPHAIARLPMDRVKRAVELVESGQTVFVPSFPVTPQEESEVIRDWDTHGEF